MQRRTPDHPRLYAIAESQQGLFTAKQAKACGYAENTHTYHVRQGHWGRERRGIYRLVLFPLSDEDQLVLWSLWSMNRKEQPQGVYSHATALTVHDLSDAMPDRLHLTVPRNFHRFREPPAILVLHKADLEQEEVEARHGFAVTTPIRTLLDVGADVTMPDDLVEAMVRDALRTGLVSQAQLKNNSECFPDRLIRIAGVERSQ